MTAHTSPIDTPADALAQRVHRFNARDEIRWFGLRGEVLDGTEARVRFAQIDRGVLGGGGQAAVNGGVIAAGFDAACVLAALSGHDTDLVLTLTLNVQYLRLARVSPGLVFRARITKRASTVCFVDAELVDEALPDRPPLAKAQATLMARLAAPADAPGGR